MKWKYHRVELEQNYLLSTSAAVSECIIAHNTVTHDSEHVQFRSLFGLLLVRYVTLNLDIITLIAQQPAIYNGAMTSGAFLWLLWSLSRLFKREVASCVSQLNWQRCSRSPVSGAPQLKATDWVSDNSIQYSLFTFGVESYVCTSELLSYWH